MVYLLGTENIPSGGGKSLHKHGELDALAASVDEDTKTVDCKAIPMQSQPHVYWTV